MMARLYPVIVVLWLLAGVSRFGEGTSNPGFVARVSRKGLEYGKGIWPFLLVSRSVVTRTRKSGRGFGFWLTETWVMSPSQLESHHLGYWRVRVKLDQYFPPC